MLTFSTQKRFYHTLTGSLSMLLKTDGRQMSKMHFKSYKLLTMNFGLENIFRENTTAETLEFIDKRRYRKILLVKYFVYARI